MTNNGTIKHLSVWKRYGYTWVTAGLFLVSLIGHWSWPGAPTPTTSASTDRSRNSRLPAGNGPGHPRDWQSEFLQLIWQVAGLSLLLHVGSPQSHEEDDRLEEKIDAILRAVSPKAGERIITELNERFDHGESVA